ncbi:unnamed protein product [Musa acuminata subsp. burmannicoides]
MPPIDQYTEFMLRIKAGTSDGNFDVRSSHRTRRQGGGGRARTRSPQRSRPAVGTAPGRALGGAGSHEQQVRQSLPPVRCCFCSPVAMSRLCMRPV